jgi:hypothetical protein
VKDAHLTGLDEVTPTHVHLFVRQYGRLDGICNGKEGSVTSFGTTIVNVSRLFLSAGAGRGVAISMSPDVLPLPESHLMR